MKYVGIVFCLLAALSLAGNVTLLIVHSAQDNSYNGETHVGAAILSSFMALIGALLYWG